MVDNGETSGTLGQSNIALASGKLNNNFIKVENKIYLNKDLINFIYIDTTYSAAISTIEPQTTTTYYVMRAKDPDCGVTTYVTWIVTGTPDSDASEYAGSKCGANPLTDIVVLFKYTE